MPTSDLASLVATKAWLSINNTDSDGIIAPLITAASRLIYGYIGRSSILPGSVTERQDGYGYHQNQLMLRNFPVLSVTSLTLGSVLVPAATTPGPGAASPSGYLLEPWDGTPPGRMQSIDLFRYGAPMGRQSIVVTYVAGYQVTGESAVVPSAPGPYAVTTVQPFGPWGSDGGVSYVVSGLALIQVPQGTTPGTGQYALGSVVGQYLFSVGDAGAAVSINYGFVPQDLAQACVELVAERFRYRSRVGEQSHSLGGQETVSFSLKNLPDTTKLMLQPYKRVVPL